MIVLLLVAGSLYLAYVFSYLYLWTVSPQSWAASELLPPAMRPVTAALLFAVSSALLLAARAVLERTTSKMVFAGIMLSAMAALVCALSIDTFAHWSTGLRPSQSAYAAMVYMNAVLQAEIVAALIVMAGFAIARRLANRLDVRRPTAFNTLSVMWHYTVGQALVGLALVHGAPQLLS